MKVKTQFTLGGATYELEVEEREEMDTLHKAIVLTNPRRECNHCGSDGLDDKHFQTNKDQEGNIYVNVECSACGARSKLGRYKAGGYFWREYEKYQPQGGNSNESRSNPRQSAPARGTRRAAQEEDDGFDDE